MKYGKILFISLLLLVLTSLLTAVEKFQPIAQWTYEEVINGFIYVSTIDNDGHVIVGFMRSGLRYITPEKMEVMAPFGQGEGDIMNFMAAINYNRDILIIENMSRGKIFTLVNGKYKEKGLWWFKQGTYAFLISDGVFFNDKCFLVGKGNANFDPKIQKLFYIKAYDNQGTPLATLLHKETEIIDQRHLMSYFITVSQEKEKLYYLAENELKVAVICPKELKVINETLLESPPFYKKMPETNYIRKEYYNDHSKLLLDTETWRTNYSNITKVQVQGNHLVVQIRTCSDKLKKFALLFYNLDNFKLTKIFYIDDYLLGTKDGKYYCYANGNPTLDEDTDTCTINIYSIIDQKE